MLSSHTQLVTKHVRTFTWYIRGVYVAVLCKSSSTFTVDSCPQVSQYLVLSSSSRQTALSAQTVFNPMSNAYAIQNKPLSAMYVHFVIFFSPLLFVNHMVWYSSNTVWDQGCNSTIINKFVAFSLCSVSF
jgi:uncharacterized membrane protein